MKRYTRIISQWLFVMAALPVALVGCSNDDPIDPQPADDPCTEVAPTVVVMTYDTFTAPTDVAITTADTTQIEVNKAYLKRTKKQIAVGSVLSIWRTIETRPFIRKVTGVKTEDDRLIVTSTIGDIGDVFSNADVDLSTALYVNPSNGLTSADRYVNAEEGTIHPAVIIVENEGANYADADNSNDNVAAVPRAYTAEQLLAEQEKVNATWHIIDKTATATMLFQPDKNIRFGIENATIRTFADLDISFKVKWFKLKKFDFVVHTGVDAKVPVVFDVQTRYEWSKEVMLAQLPTYTTVFFIGIVPVGITIDPSLQLSLNAKASARAGVTIPLEAHAELTLGPSYDGKWGFKNHFSATAKAPVDQIRFMGEMSASASASVFLKVGSYLYGLAGPTVQLGPTVETENAVKINPSNGLFLLQTTGTFKIDSKIGAELKVGKWSLASYEYTLPASCKQQLWKWEHEY